MAEFVKIKDFLKPSFEAIQKEKDKQIAESGRALVNLLENDGAPIAKGIIEFLARAFVDIVDGATCVEWEKQTENLEIYLNIKKRGANEQ